MDRRALIGGFAAAAATPALAAGRLAELEARSGGRLGVYAVNTKSGRRLAHRADERFAMCSTFKLALAGAVLARIEHGWEQPGRMIAFGPPDMRSHAPVSETYLAKGAIPVAVAVQAIVEVSDNPAANLLLATLGGPPGWTRYVRGLGDRVSRLDRWELELNSAAPRDPRDTTTPRAMTGVMNRMLLGKALEPASRERLLGWMAASASGAKRLRAGLPAGWRAGDKTGTGSNGSTNDIAVLWPPGGAPILAACYLTATRADLAAREQVHADVGRLIAAELA